jgi:competence protein ComEC
MENNGFSGGWRSRIAGRHPLLALALVAAACVIITDWQPWLGWLAAGVCGLLGWSCRGWRMGLTWWMIGCLATGLHAWRETAAKDAHHKLMETVTSEVTAKVLEDARGTQQFWSAPVEIITGPGAGQKIWWEGRGKLPVAGSRIRARGNFEPLQKPRNPGEFDRAKWLRNQGVVAIFDAARFEGTLETPSLAQRGAAIRHGFRLRVTAGLDEDSQAARVIRAVVIGESPPDSQELIAAFRLSGSLHVFSVSGLHVAMVGGIGWFLLSWAGVPRRRAVVVLLPLIFGYAWITGHGAPAVRSAWMAAVFLGAFVFRRKPDLLNALGAVLLAAMMWDGRLIFQPGVQLSYGVVAAIAIGTSWAAKTFTWMSAPELYVPESLMTRWQRHWLALRRYIAGSLAVSVAAGIGSAPLTAFHFGLVTPISMLAGLALVPMVFGLLAAALVSVGTSLLAPPVSRGINQLNGHLANACAATASGFASLPGGHFQVRRQTEPALVVFDLDYGAGAACFADGNGGGVLLDCGSQMSFKRLVAPALVWHGVEPDAVVLSHPDSGHLGGGAQVWETFPIRQALMPVKMSRSPSFRAWIGNAPKHGIRLLHPANHSIIPIADGTTLEILHQPDPLALHSLADERVMVFRLHWNGWKLLFTSDAGLETENRMLAAGKNLSADVIIAGNHRSDLTLGDAFLDAVNPQALIASNPRFGTGDQRQPATIAYWKSRGIHVLDQAVSGGVTVTQEHSGALILDGFLDGSSLRLEKQPP